MGVSLILSIASFECVFRTNLWPTYVISAMTYSAAGISFTAFHTQRPAVYCIQHVTQTRENQLVAPFHLRQFVGLLVLGCVGEDSGLRAR